MSKLTMLLWGSWSWKRPLYTIAFIYFTLAIVAIFFAHKFIFFPPSNHYNEKIKNLSIIKNGDKSIATLHYPARQGMPTILWSHGNAEDIGLLTDIFIDFNSLGYGILAYDYPGYGLSDGSPTEASCYQAADAAYTHLTKFLQIPEDQIIVLGQSIGTGPTHYLAEKHQPNATILLSPFTSIYRVGVKYSMFPRDRFPNLKRIQNIKSPILFIHGENDKVIPFSHSKTLMENHSGKNEILALPHTGHNNMYDREYTTIIKTIDEFIKSHALPAQH